jgi:hypothetical protein
MVDGGVLPTYLAWGETTSFLIFNARQSASATARVLAATIDVAKDTLLIIDLESAAVFVAGKVDSFDMLKDLVPGKLTRL